MYANGYAIRVEFFGDEIDRISEINPVTGQAQRVLQHVAIYPASHYVTTKEKMERAVQEIERELAERKAYFEDHGKLIEAQRIDQRTRYDVEMMRELGYCTGIENYSRVISGTGAGFPAHHAAGLLPGGLCPFCGREPCDPAAGAGHV